MRAVRIKKGWRLHLTDAEMQVVQEAVYHLQADWENPDDLNHLDGAVRKAYQENFTSTFWPDNIEDYR